MRLLRACSRRGLSFLSASELLLATALAFLLGLGFFGVLFKLVANESIDESDNEVEDHGGDAPLPDGLDEGLFLGVEFLLSLEESLLLGVNGLLDA